MAKWGWGGEVSGSGRRRTEKAKVFEATTGASDSSTVPLTLFDSLGSPSLSIPLLNILSTFFSSEQT
jgi:hypothetical protein